MQTRSNYKSTAATTKARLENGGSKFHKVALDLKTAAAMYPGAVLCIKVRRNFLGWPKGISLAVLKDGQILNRRQPADE